MTGGLREISRLLGDRQYAVNNSFGLADIAVGSCLGWLGLRMPDMNWREHHPNLARLADHLEQRPSFRNSVPSTQLVRDKVA